MNDWLELKGYRRTDGTFATPTIFGTIGDGAGGGNFGLMAGPCSVESEEQLLKTAHAVKAAGATILRGGAFKPRTSPYEFQGLGREGLLDPAVFRGRASGGVLEEMVQACKFMRLKILIAAFA